MSDKLSQEELIEELDYFYRAYPANLAWRHKQAYNQIKSLLQPVDEEKLNDLIWRKISEWEITGFETRIDLIGFFHALIEEYEGLRRKND